MKQKDWALETFIVAVLALVVGTAAIFVNGLMNDEARQLTGLEHKSPSPPTNTTSPVLPQSTSAPAATSALVQPPPAPAGTEFTIVEEESSSEPQILPRQESVAPPAFNRRAPASEGGTRYELSKRPAEVDSSVRLVFEKDQ